MRNTDGQKKDKNECMRQIYVQQLWMKKTDEECMAKLLLGTWDIIYGDTVSLF